MFSRVTYVLMIVALGGFLTAAGTVQAETITIANPGIEIAGSGQVAQDWWGQYRQTGGGAGEILPHGGGWAYNTRGDYGPVGQEVALKVGTDNLHMSVGDQITIDFYHGIRSDHWGRGSNQLTMYLRTGSNGTGALLATQTFTDPEEPAGGGYAWKAQSFTYTAVAAAVGQDLYFEFDSNGGGADRQIWLDDFSGTYTPIPEPGTLALLATGLIGLLCYAWRKRK